MENIAKAVVGLSVLAFLLAVVVSLIHTPVMGIPAEGFSRACSNLALIGIAAMMMGKKG